MKYIKDVIQDNFRGIQEEFNLHIKKAHYVILCWLVEFKFKKKKKERAHYGPGKTDKNNQQQYISRLTY